LLACLCLAVLTPAATGVVRAHPTADTFVVITLDDRHRFTVSVSSNAEALKLKIDALGGSLASHLDVRFDGQRAMLVPAGTRDVAGRPDVVSVDLSGRVPASAGRMTFRSTAIFGTYPLLVRRANDEEAPDDRYEWLSGARTSRAYDLSEFAAAPAGATFFDAAVLGFRHIVPDGLDHILFVLGLFLLTTRVRAILIQVSAFTAAHSLTLGLGLAGVVSMPAAMVEPLIALSIVYVGVENLRSTSLARARVVVVFGFGLLHGLGFAEALASLELSRGGWLTTLAGFNVGVEIGQLAVIALAALAAWSLGVQQNTYRAWIVRPASLTIAVCGVLWPVDRVA
jgi:hypothetical protein